MPVVSQQNVVSLLGPASHNSEIRGAAAEKKLRVHVKHTDTDGQKRKLDETGFYIVWFLEFGTTTMEEDSLAVSQKQPYGTFWKDASRVTAFSGRP